MVFRFIRLFRLWTQARQGKRSHLPPFQIGDAGQTETPLNPTGYVYLNGEIWPAVAENQLPQGVSIQVVGTDATRLKVQAQPFQS